MKHSLLVLCVSVGLWGMGFPIAGADEEPNQRLDDANRIALNSSVAGSLSDAGDIDIIDIYRVEVPENGILQAGVVPTADLRLTVGLLDTPGNTYLKKRTGDNPGDTAGFVMNNLRKGDYYVVVQTAGGAGEYSFTLNYAASSDVDEEPNDHPAQAKALITNEDVSGNLGYHGNAFTDSIDLFYVEMELDGGIELQVFPDGTLRTRLELYDVDGSKLLASVDNNGVGGSEKIVSNNLAAGVYYVAVRLSEGYGSYTLTSISTLLTAPNDVEPVPSFAEAVVVEWLNTKDAAQAEQTYTAVVSGHLGYYQRESMDQMDVYQVQIPQYGRLNVHFDSQEGNTGEINFHLFDAEQRLVVNYPNLLDWSHDLAAGWYYLQYQSTNRFGGYTLTLTLEPKDEPPLFSEPASTFALNQETVLTLSETQPLHFYLIPVTDDGEIEITGSMDPALWGRVHLFRIDGTTNMGNIELYFTEDEKSIDVPNLIAGEYVLRVQRVSGEGSVRLGNAFEPVTQIDAMANDSWTDLPANPLTGEVVGHIGYVDSLNWIDRFDYHRFDLPTDGILRFTCQADSTAWVRFKLFRMRQDGQTQLLSEQEAYFTPDIKRLEVLNAQEGRYFVRVDHISQYGSYVISPEFISNQSGDPEPNDALFDAVRLEIGEGITGHLGFEQLQHKDDKDWYSIVLPEDGTLSVHIGADASLWYRLELYSRDGMKFNTNAEGYFTTAERSIQKQDLTAGEYLIHVVRISQYGTYGLYTTFQAQQHSDTEPNINPALAIELTLNQQVYGSLGYQDQFNIDGEDWYRVQINETGRYSVEVEAEATGWMHFDLYRADALQRIGRIERYFTSLPLGAGFDLEPGTYYLRSGLVSKFGAYTLRIGSEDEGVSGTLAGSVKGANGLPLFEIQCEIQGQTLTSDFSGAFRFETLLPGEYAVTFGSGSKYYSEVRHVTIAPGETTELEVVLLESNKTAPADVAVFFANAQDGYIHFHWSPSVSPDVHDGGGYKLYIDDDPARDLGNVQMFRSGGFANGRTYVCRITVYDKFGNESDGYTLSVTPDGEGTVIQPTPTVPPSVNTPTPTPQPEPPTPTPTITPTALIEATPSPTATPVIEPTPTQAALQVPEPFVVYEFAEATVSANGWGELPGGFGDAVPGAVFPQFQFSAGQIPSSEDQTGLAVLVQQQQVTFLLTESALDTQGYPVLMRLTLRANSDGAAVVLGALKGDIYTGEALDGSIGMDQKTNTGALVDEAGRMCMIYQADRGTWIHPFVQVAANNRGSVSVYLDKLEIFIMKEDTVFPASMFFNIP